MRSEGRERVEAKCCWDLGAWARKTNEKRERERKVGVISGFIIEMTLFQFFFF